MNLGFVGVGKLGLPVALCLAQHHDVVVTDMNPAIKGYLETQTVPYREAGLDEYLQQGHAHRWRDTISEVVAESDIVFVAVQTPHAPQYEGTTPLTDDRADFDYSYLHAAVREIAHNASEQAKPVTLVVVSTVLPGTTDRLLRPALNEFVSLVYSPSFIAMGTTRADFEDPEMVLVGRDPGTTHPLAKVFAPIHSAPIVEVSIPSAELAKVAYNTTISAKIAIANTLMEFCHTGSGDVDEVSYALSHATRRLWSPAYTKGGMGDSGGCHPRDNIALSHLARSSGLSFDLFGTLMQVREAQSQWLADLVAYHSQVARLPVVVLGKSYKKETNLTVGSSAALLVHQLDDSDTNVVWDWFDPHVDSHDFDYSDPAVFVVATNHPEFGDVDYPTGSVVVDPWGYISDRAGVTVVRVGRKT